MSPNAIYLNAFWENILEKLKNELSKPSFETWLASTKLVDFTNNKLTLVWPTISPKTGWRAGILL